MLDQLLRLARRRQVQDVGDAVLAAVLALSSLGTIIGKDDPSWGRPMALGISLALAASVPVAWRSRYPFVAATIVLIANGACVYAAAPRQAAFQPFVALVLVAYSVGSHASGRRATWLPPVLATAAAPLFVLAVAHGQSAGNAFPSYVWLLSAWLIGRTVRSLRSKSQELELANRELAEQRELQAQAAVAVERSRIARELHDVIAHHVSMMVVQASAAEGLVEREPGQVRAALDVIAVTGRETIDQMRTLLGVLRTNDRSTRAPQPGLGDLEQLLTGVREAGLPVTLQIVGTPRPMPPALDLSAYRIVQEGLTNTMKHAGNASAQVTVRYLPGALELEVIDSGHGGITSNGANGHGLIGMSERVAMFGGQFEAARHEGGGFAVRALLPIGAAQ